MTENPPSTLNNGPVLNQRLVHHTRAILDMSVSWVLRCSFFFLSISSCLAFSFVLIIAIQFFLSFFCCFKVQVGDTQEYLCCSCGNIFCLSSISSLQFCVILHRYSSLQRSMVVTSPLLYLLSLTNAFSLHQLTQGGLCIRYINHQK